MSACQACGQTKPDAVERDLPLRTIVCDDCWTIATTEPDDHQADDVPRADVPAALDTIADRWTRSDPREGGEGTCNRCGATVAWYRTENGRPIPMETHEFDTRTVAPGHRWRIAGNGVAVLIPARANPTDITRATHFDACPAQHPPTHSPALLTLWQRRAAHRAP